MRLLVQISSRYEFLLLLDSFNSRWKEWGEGHIMQAAHSPQLCFSSAEPEWHSRRATAGQWRVRTSHRTAWQREEWAAALALRFTFARTKIAPPPGPLQEAHSWWAWNSIPKDCARSTLSYSPPGSHEPRWSNYTGRNERRGWWGEGRTEGLASLEKGNLGRNPPSPKTGVRVWAALEQGGSIVFIRLYLGIQVCKMQIGVIQNGDSWPNKLGTHRLK